MLHYSNIRQCTLLHFLSELLVQYFHYGQCNYICKVLIMYRIMGEAGGKHVISAMHKVIVLSPMSNTAKCVSKKSLPSMMGLVIGRTKHCCVKITF